MRAFTAALLLLASLAYAQQNNEPKKQKVPPKTELVFSDGTEIGGDIAGANLEVISTPPNPKFKSIIKVRDNFRDKFMQSMFEL